ncbi:MAG: T9SS type A sorting domain-containing protein [Fibromonadaceae bacterium]|jgi:hypothetical protein|nr:T9SS type A sorting domain-containing protein [Fibromonadaceae bacterium]
MKNISNKALAFAILCSLGAHISFAQCNASLFAGGTGTEADPYQISTPEQLQNLNKCLKNSRNNYVLNNDIDLTQYLQGEGNNGGAGWKPIGTLHKGFYGKLNGNGHKVTGLWISRPTEEVVGLFGKASKEISNINVEIDYFLNGGVRGSGTVGGLVGYNEGIISNSYVTGNVSGEYGIGGLVGENNGTISNSHTTGNIWGSKFTGGLTGYNGAKGSINESYASGNVLGGYCGCIGSLVGANKGEISNSKSDNESNNNYDKQTIAMTAKEAPPMPMPMSYSNIEPEIEYDPIALPNPKPNTIQLSNLPPNTNVEIYNAQGKRIYFGNSENSQIRIPVQTKGIYIVKIGSQTIRAVVK